MAVTKILARKGRLDIGINYILNGDKTQEQILTYHQRCDPNRECREMMRTKRFYGKEGGVQYYHIIQSFKPGEISPDLALEIAKEFVAEHLPGYEAVIGVHTDRGHIHAHIVFNSVCQETGGKYHSSPPKYYKQIRTISDRLCREHGLSVIMAGESSQAVSYIEWLRQSKGQPTFRSMLEADILASIEDANDLGHFFLLMEHKGYEISHGNRLGFRLRGQPRHSGTGLGRPGGNMPGQERFMYPGRKDPRFTEDGIQNAIHGILEEIEAGRRPAVTYRTPYQPYRKHPKYAGFVALYIHYLYVLGKIQKREYPPRMTPWLKQEVMKFEQYREKFVFLRENDIATPEDMAVFQKRTEETLADLTKQHTILNVRKKKRAPLYAALADAESLAITRQLYDEGLSGMEEQFARYMEAVATLQKCGIPKERLTKEKAELYEQLAQLNRQIRSKRKKLALCREIQEEQPRLEQELQSIEITKMEVKRDEHWRR